MTVDTTSTAQNGDADEGAPTTTPAGMSAQQAMSLWDRWSREPAQSPRRGRWLAEARRGAGKKAGTAPGMWPLYREHRFDGHHLRDDRELAADHICMVLFAFHQQSQNDAVHRPKITFGMALRRLRNTDRFHDRQSALDVRVYAAATAADIFELEIHLRSIVRLLKDEGIGFDYTALYRDLVEWQEPGGSEAVRQRWGRDYYWQPVKGKDAAAKPSSSSKGE